MSKPQSIKVLHVTRAEVLGIRTFLRGLLANMDRDRFEIEVAGPMQGPLVQDLEQLSVPGLYCHMERDIKLAADLRTLVQLCRLVRRERPDVLHLHGAKAGFLGRIAGRLNRVPAIVYTPNNDYLDEPMPKLRRHVLVWLEKLALPMGHRIVSVSREERQNWIRRGICEPGDIAMIYDGFDFSHATALVPRDEGKRALGIPQHCQVVGLIARLVPQKAPDVFLRAASRILEMNPDTHFLVVGDGPLRAEMEKLARSLQIQDRVWFLGYLENLANVYSAMDVSVLTSRYEGLPMVVLESMYLGIPVVVSRTYGAAEVISEGCGILTPVLDADATAEAILAVLRDRDMARRMCIKARTRVLAEFGAELMAQQYQELYLELAGVPCAEKSEPCLLSSSLPGN